MRFIVIKITILLIFLNIQLFATIVNTKHNLSISNTAGTIKALNNINRGDVASDNRACRCHGGGMGGGGIATIYDENLFP